MDLAAGAIGRTLFSEFGVQLINVARRGSMTGLSAYLSQTDQAIVTRRSELQIALQDRAQECSVLLNRSLFLRDKYPLLRELTSENVRRLAANLKTREKVAA